MLEASQRWMRQDEEKLEDRGNCFARERGHAIATEQVEPRSLAAVLARPTVHDGRQHASCAGCEGVTTSGHGEYARAKGRFVDVTTTGECHQIGWPGYSTFVPFGTVVAKSRPR